MYRAMIVDDEPEIRQGLRLKVDWEALGLRIAGEAANGAEALALLDEQPFDVVVTDMNMPSTDGRMLLEACRELYPALRLIVITGYEDFQYAHAAIRSRVRDYLLKPVGRDELAAALRKVKRELDEERETHMRAASVQWRLSQYYGEMKEHFIVHLVRGGQEREARERAAMFELQEWDGQPVRFVTAGLPERSAADGAPERAPTRFRLPFELLCREIAQTSIGSPIAYRDPNYPGLMHFVLRAGRPEEAAFSGGLREGIRAHIGFEPTIGIGEPVAGFPQWQEGYLASLLAWNLAESRIQDDVRRPTEEQPTLPHEKVTLFRRLLERGRLDRLEEAIGRELREAHGQSQARLVKIIFQLHLMLEAAASEANVPLGDGDHLWLRPELALGLDTPEKAGRFLMRLAGKIDRGRRPDGDADGFPVEAALRFIEENYRYDLSLTAIAERFNYNPSYFSELFKAKVGATFIQHVTEVRMAQAIRLLEETELGLWDIAELTGFSNASYFSTKFKRMYGVTPSDYRQSPEKYKSALPKK